MDEPIIVEEFSDNDIRRTMWHKTITSVGLVTSRYNGQDNVMACEWAIQIGFNPPTYLVVIGKSHASAEFISNTGVFGLTFASDQQAKLAHVSGSYTRYETDKLGMGIYPMQEGKTINAPLIQEGTLAVECKVIETVDLDNRFIFIGEAQYAEYRDDKSPLLYHGGKYFKVGENVPKSSM